MPIKGSNTAEKKLTSLDKLKQLSQRGSIDVAHEEQASYREN